MGRRKKKHDHRRIQRRYRSRKRVSHTSTKATKNDGGDTLRFSVSLTHVQGVQPIAVDFDKNATLEEMTHTVNKMLNLSHNGLQVARISPAQRIPRSFTIKVGASDVIDFERRKFCISSTSRFVAYWNDFLDEAKLFDEEKMSNKRDEGGVRFDGALQARLNSDSSLTIGDARIQFQRTLRIPDDGKMYPLPPSLGAFPC